MEAGVSDLEFYEDPEPPKVWQDLATTAGVAKGYVVLQVDGEVTEVLDGALISEGDGKLYWEPNNGGESPVGFDLDVPRPTEDL
jgi:hypothetical protein